MVGSEAKATGEPTSNWRASEERGGSVHPGCWAENGQGGSWTSMGLSRREVVVLDQNDGHADGRGGQIPGKFGVC